MKKFPFLSFLALVFLSISCSINQDYIVQSSLYGTWEHASTLEESSLDLVNTFVFNENGTFEARNLFRETNSPTIVGFKSIISGTFVLQGNTLTINETRLTRFPAGSDRWYVLENELEEHEWNRVTEIMLKLKENRSQLAMDYGPCPPNAFCIGPVTYFRVGR